MSDPGESAASGGRRVLKNTAALAVARLLDRASTLVVALLIASSLGAEGLGAYSIAMAVYGVIVLAGDAGMTMFLIREISRDLTRTGSYLVHLGVVAVLVSAVLCGVAYAVVPHLGYAPDVSSGVLIVVLAIFPRALASIQEAAFVAHGRTELQTVTTFLTTLIYLGLSIWLLGSGYGVTSLLTAYVAVQYAMAAIYFALITRYIVRIPLHFRWSTAWRLARELKSFAGSSALAAFLARPEILILSFLASEREVGYYSAAIRVAEVWVFIPQVFMNNVFPLLSRSFYVGDGRFAAIQERAMRAVLAYTLPLTAGMVVAAPLIVTTLFGDDFAPAADLLRILGLNVTLYAMSSVYWRSLAARDRQDAVLRVQVVMIVSRLGGGAALIAALGALGAAVSATASSALSLVLLSRATRRSGTSAPSPLVGWRFGAAACVMALAILAAEPWLTLWALVPAAAIVYLAAAIGLKAFTPDDVRLLRGARALPGVPRGTRSG
jgi:O-antigen/teichoic acid export membrane protein